MKKTSFLLPAAVLVAGVSAAQATLFAYEGFNAPTLVAAPTIPAPDGTPLNAINASGTGWLGGWTVSNGNSTDSVFQSAGLSFPASYPGSFTAVGGNGLNKGNTANSMLRLNLDAATATAVNTGGIAYVSFLGMRQGPITPDTGVDGTSPAGTFLNPYPRNAGARFLNNATANNNTSMGLIGSNGNALENNGWGVWGWKDTNGQMTGADIAGAVDFVVVRLDMNNSVVNVWVNPGVGATTYDGYYGFNYTDNGNPVNMALYAFGVEAGSLSGNRYPGEWVFDEIRIASTFEEAAGFVPEPSTYAAVLGLLALGLVYLRRRRK